MKEIYGKLCVTTENTRNWMKIQIFYANFAWLVFPVGSRLSPRTKKTNQISKLSMYLYHRRISMEFISMKTRPFTLIRELWWIEDNMDPSKYCTIEKIWLTFFLFARIFLNFRFQRKFSFHISQFIFHLTHTQINYPRNFPQNLGHKQNLHKTKIYNFFSSNQNRGSEIDFFSSSSLLLMD